MLVHVHEVKQQGFTEIVVALSDKELVGRTIGGTFFVNPRFYGGEELGEEEVKEAILNASIVNAIGNASVSFLIDNGFVLEDDIVRVDDVMHAQIFVVEERG